jgi:integrase
MKVVMQHLQRDRKSGLLSYRRRFPQDLVPFIPSQGSNGLGRLELKVSLRSPSISDPIARARYAEAEAQFNAIVEKARRVATNNYDRLDPVLVRHLADAYLHDHLESDEAMRWQRRQLPAKYPTRGNPQELYDDCKEMLEEYDAVGLEAYWKDWACGYAEALGHLIARNDPDMASLCRALAEAACSVWLAVDSRIDGRSAVTPAKPVGFDPGPGVRRETSNSSGPKISLLGLYERYAGVPGRHPKTIAQWRPYIEHLSKFVGGKSADQVTHDDLVAWRNHLRDKETYRKKPLSAKTINGSYMGAVAALYAWAKGDGIVARNPTLEVSKVKAPAQAVTRSKEFTKAEVELILTAALAIDRTASGAEGLRSAKRWAPWLMAYSGARVNEITQLRKEDVFEREGVWVMRITPEAGTVKTKAYRLVPLHSHIIEQGFVKFVDARADGPLFYDPAKRRSNKAINRQASSLGSRVARWVRSLGIDEAVKPNHAWRHYFSSYADRYGMNERVSNVITGHVGSSVKDKTYMGGVREQVDRLSAEMEKLPRHLSSGHLRTGS